MIEIQSYGGASWVGIISIVDAAKRVGGGARSLRKTKQTKQTKSRTNFSRYISKMKTSFVKSEEEEEEEKVIVVSRALRES